MDDLVRWLRAQLDEDERVARGAIDNSPWRAAVRSGLDVVEGDGWTVCNASEADTAHIAEWDPARVLREIDAKRRIIATLHEEGGDRMFADIFSLLALPYADRPGYREHWRP
ncbi:DUF6221 family protein [Streptomyces tendae]|uniref:DUF6221 family protein n=1 Tax=Streptomyces tendae TaxID=1932 RepID=UPI0033C872A7